MAFTLEEAYKFAVETYTAERLHQETITQNLGDSHNATDSETGD